MSDRSAAGGRPQSPDESQRDSDKVDTAKPPPSTSSPTDDANDKSAKFITFPPVSPDEHPLQYKYSLWFSRKSSGHSTADQYDKNLTQIGTFETVEQFWSLYCHLVRPSDVSFQCDYHLFKTGIRPMWEDDANKCGGKWIIRLKKGICSRVWENLVLAVLGEQLMVGDEVCGAVISVRFQEDILALWNRTASDTVTTNRIRDVLKRVLNLPTQTIMEYKQHMDSINLDVYNPEVSRGFIASMENDFLQMKRKGSRSY